MARFFYVIADRSQLDVSVGGSSSWATQSFSKESVAHVQKYLTKNEVPNNLFEVNPTRYRPLVAPTSSAAVDLTLFFSNTIQPYIEEIFTHLRGDIFRKFIESDKYTRFCQWKNLELNMQVSDR